MATPPEDSRGSRPSRSAEATARAFRRGAPDAVAAVGEYVRKILFFQPWRPPPEVLQDLQQEAMSHIWSAATRPGFDPAAGFWGFVETVTVRRCIDWRRRQRQTTELSDSAGDSRPGPLGDLLERERRSRVERAIGQLAEPCRRLFELHFIRRLTYRQAAVELGRSEGALRVQMYRCIRQVRQILQEEEDGRSTSRREGEP